MLYMLAVQAAKSFVQLPRKPPVTTSLIAIQTFIYLRPGKFDEILPTLSEVCLNPHFVIKDRDLKRLMLSAFYHVDEMHLMYNMTSLMWKGVQLEDTMGSQRFAKMVAVLLGLSHSLILASSSLLAKYADAPAYYYSECAVGFSGVLFALKVVLNYNSPSHTNVYGIMVPSRYAAWVELVVIQMFVPGTSFLGHLCGILAGVIYMNAPSSLSLSRIFEAFSWPVKRLWWFLGRSSRGRTFGRGTTAGSRPPNTTNRGRSWSCRLCTYENNASVDACQMCGSLRQGPDAADDSTPPSAPPMPNRRGRSLSPMSREELRQARLSRFNR